ncbi:hypothetical protein FXO38_33233 [Capsicum annuum]|nr:hypothetical protein FXO38_33233 [Capsicum annuum]KAF3623572.1 hypothetical protein FXO37_31813 [Capsicum annuum]
MAEATGKLNFCTKHAYLMHEYMSKLVHDCMTEYATVRNTNFIIVTEHGTDISKEDSYLRLNLSLQTRSEDTWVEGSIEMNLGTEILLEYFPEMRGGQQTIVKLRYIPHCRKQCIIRESKESRDNLMAFRDIVQLSLGIANMKDVKYCPLESENFVPCFNVSKNLNLGLSKSDEVYRLMMLEEEQLSFRSDSAMFDSS